MTWMTDDIDIVLYCSFVYCKIHSWQNAVIRK